MLTFVFGKFVDTITSPTALLLLSAFIGLLLTARRHDSVAGRRLLWIGVGGFVLLQLLPVDQWALLPLEDRFPQVTHPPAHVDGIIVLGGAIETELSADRGIPALNGDAERITEAVILARRYPTARLIYTGGEGALIPSGLAEADAARSLFTAMGVAPDRLTLEDRSRTTYANAVLTKALVQPQPGQIWILLTSAYHMPRSVGVFRAVGWQVLPWPVGYKSGHDLLTWMPRMLGIRLNQLDDAVHEWVGLIAYRLMGRTDTLFPGPDN